MTADGPSVSVVIPVKNGARYLAEVLEALARQPVPNEVLVIDSGSTDASVSIARAGGAEVLSIPAAEFGHGRTRNLGADRTRGDIICFLTQDATPTTGWLNAICEGFALDPEIGVVYGPHLPRPGTSPMIARELTEFFATMSPNGTVTIAERGGAHYISNVNAAYRRNCLEQIRFRDLPYAEDQAFGVDMLEQGWTKAFHPGAAVLHSHDYGFTDFMRRYFDEYRGLRSATGWIEPFHPKGAMGGALRLTRRDRAWMAEHGWPRRARAAWTARAFAHHLGRKVFAALGSRSERLPGPIRRQLSLEGRTD